MSRNDRSESRWVHPTYLYSGLVLAGGIAAVAARSKWGALASIAVALPTIVGALWMGYRISLYPHIYKGWGLVVAGLLASYVTLGDSLGELAYGSLWERAFGLRGDPATYVNPEMGWSILYPERWTAFKSRVEEVESVLFKPNQVTPAVEFGVTHRAVDPDAAVSDVATGFLLSLPKSGATQIIRRESVPYGTRGDAYEVVYQDPDQTIVLRNRLVFVKRDAELYILSVAAVPAWFDRLSDHADRFLFSFQPPA